MESHYKIPVACNTVYEPSLQKYYSGQFSHNNTYVLHYNTALSSYSVSFSV